MLRDRRLAFASVMVATTLRATAHPGDDDERGAVHRHGMDEPLDRLEGDERCDDEQRDAVPGRCQNLRPLHAERVRARLGRAARRNATSDPAIAPTSASMWPASASSARECERNAVATSNAMKAARSPRVIVKYR